MTVGSFRLGLLLAVFWAVALAVIAQSPRDGQKRNPRPETANPQSSPEPSVPNSEVQDQETIKTDTNLVVVPVIATDTNGLYLPDMNQSDFRVFEDGVEQEIAFFATTSTPFHVVLMLDTSASTEEKLGSIQRAATAFVEQLQSADRVKVISFDDEVRDLNEFTSDRSMLRSAINQTRPGQGTKLYDAFELAISSLNRISGRKAIVLFSDGVDWHSSHASFDDTLRGLDEAGVIVYPIRYDTRAETEQIARQQEAESTPELPTLDVIRKSPNGTTAPTFPSDEPIPTSGTQPKTGPFGLPLPAEILRRRREADPNRYPSPGELPPDVNRRTERRTLPPPGPTSPPVERNDTVSGMLDALYLTADSYLKALADKSGGRLLRADKLDSLPAAFAQIAGELRTQYAIGYYPANKAKDNTYRRIKVTTKRKQVILRARPGYHAPAAN